MEATVTLTTVVSIFLLLLVGYAAKRFGALKADDTAVVNSILINLTLPAYIFVAAHNKPLVTSMIKAPAVGIVLQIAIMCAAYGAAKLLRLDRRTTGALMIVSAFGNTGYLGYPVVGAAFPGSKHAMLTAVMMDQFCMRIVITTLGVTIAASFAGTKSDWSNVIEFFRTPLFPATVLALALKDVDLPPLLMNSISYLAGGTVPLAMISIGLSLSVGSVKAYPAAIAVAFALKMVLMPALMLLALRLIDVTGTVQKVAVLEMAMPSAVFSGIIASRYGANGAFAAAVIFVLTLASVVWIPAVLMIIG
ncbi:MAG: AEC family transporter [Armatimonadetes bacterium]|nr:AEC family transporter [Armatimonadota bacterium]